MIVNTIPKVEVSAPLHMPGRKACVTRVRFAWARIAWHVACAYTTLDGQSVEKGPCPGIGDYHVCIARTPPPPPQGWRDGERINLAFMICNNADDHGYIQ